MANNHQRGNDFYSLVTAAVLALTAALCLSVGVLAWPYASGQAAALAERATPTLITAPTHTLGVVGPTSNPAREALPTQTAAPPAPVEPGAVVVDDDLLDDVFPGEELLQATERPTATSFPTATDAPTVTLLPTTTATLTAAATTAPLEETQTPDADQPAARPAVTLNVDLISSQDRMEVRQVVDVPNTSGDEWTEVVFSVVVHNEPEAFTLDEAFAQGVRVEARLDGIMLRVPLPEPLPPGESARVELGYTVNFLTYPASATFPRGMTGRTGEVLRAGWWYPALVPYRDGEGWHTWRYHTVGDPVTFPAADYVLTVNAEPGITVAGSGAASREGNAWTFRADAARAMAFFASEAYVLSQGSANGVPIYSYHFAGDEEAGQATVNVAANVIRLYEELYGPYPYESLVMVRSRSNSDMEYTGMMSLSEEVYTDYWGTPQTALHILIAHELAHQWWYGAVGNDQVYEPWLDESLATYSEVLYYERYYPDIGLQRMSIYESRYTPGPLDLSIYDFTRTGTYIRTLYSRGAVFQRELRNAMGDAAYFGFLRDYREQYAGEIATTWDFIDTAEQHTDANLAPLWRRFFSSAVTE